MRLATGVVARGRRGGTVGARLCDTALLRPRRRRDRGRRSGRSGRRLRPCGRRDRGRRSGRSGRRLRPCGRRDRGRRSGRSGRRLRPCGRRDRGRWSGRRSGRRLRPRRRRDRGRRSGRRSDWSRLLDRGATGQFLPAFDAELRSGDLWDSAMWAESLLGQTSTSLEPIQSVRPGRRRPDRSRIRRTVAPRRPGRTTTGQPRSAPQGR